MTRENARNKIHTRGPVGCIVIICTKDKVARKRDKKSEDSSGQEFAALSCKKENEQKEEPSNPTAHGLHLLPWRFAVFVGGRPCTETTTRRSTPFDNCLSTVIRLELGFGHFRRT